MTPSAGAPARGGPCLVRRASGHNGAMPMPGVHIETLHDPTRYTHVQIEQACALAAMLNRGKLVLVEPPRR